MAVWINFANGRWNEQYQTIYCDPTTREFKGKQYQTDSYNTDTQQRTKENVDIILRNRDTGEELQVEKFQLVVNKNKTENWHPDYQVKVKVG